MALPSPGENDILLQISAELDLRPKPDRSQELGGISLWAAHGCPAPKRHGEAETPAPDSPVNDIVHDVEVPQD